MRGPRRGNCGRCEPPPYDGARRPHGGAPARRRARSGARRRSPDPPGAPSRDARSRAGPIPMLRGKTARACCGSCSVSFPGRWGRMNGPTIRIQVYLALVEWWACVWVFRWCPTLPLPGGGSTIGAGGLSFRVRYGSGRFPAPLWPPGRWWGVVLLGVGFPPGGGGGWVGSGLRSGRGWFVWCACRLFVCPLLLFAGSPRCGGRPLVGVAPLLGSPRCWGCPRVLWGGLCGVCSCWPISTGRLSPLPGVHLRPIHPVVCWGPSATPVGGRVETWSWRWFPA